MPSQKRTAPRTQQARTRTPEPPTPTHSADEVQQRGGAWSKEEEALLLAVKPFLRQGQLFRLWFVLWPGTRTVNSLSMKCGSLQVAFSYESIPQAIQAIVKKKDSEISQKTKKLACEFLESQIPTREDAAVKHTMATAGRIERARQREEETEYQYQRFVAGCVQYAEANHAPQSWTVRLPRNKSKVHYVIPTLFISDAHFGEVVNPLEIGGVNEYNSTIAEKRLKTLGERTIKMLRRYTAGVKFDGLQIAVGGDMFSGMIHEELDRTNDQEISEALVYWTDRMIALFEMLHEEFGKIDAHCVVGNHGRLDRKPTAKGRVKRNFEWIMYQFLANYFRNTDSIRIVVPDSPTTIFQTYDFRTLLTHGDDFRGGNAIAGFWSPVKRGAGKSALQFLGMGEQHQWDQMWIGHFHRWAVDGEVVVNGSLKGYDEYAYKMRYPFERPTQMLTLTTPEHGRTDYRKIFCD